MAESFEKGKSVLAIGWFDIFQGVLEIAIVRKCHLDNANP